MEPEIELLELQKEYREKDERGMPMSVRERYRERLEKLKDKAKNTARESKLGQILLEKGLISEEQLESALTQQEESRDDNLLGEILIEKGFLQWEELRAALQKQVKASIPEGEKPKPAA
mgnify:CR=1 FL=1